MHGRSEDIPLAIEAGATWSRTAEWGDMSVAFEAIAAGTDTAQMFEGLPDGRCQSRHWGYVLKGRLRVTFADHEEIIGAGEAYYLPAGHNTLVEEDAELVEFSPREEYRPTQETSAEALTGAQPGD